MAKPEEAPTPFSMKHLPMPSEGVQRLNIHYGRSAGGNSDNKYTTVNHTMKHQGPKNEQYSIHGTCDSYQLIMSGIFSLL